MHILTPSHLSRQEDVPKTLDSWDALLRAVEVLLTIHIFAGFTVAISNTGEFAIYTFRMSYVHTIYMLLYVTICYCKFV